MNFPIINHNLCDDYINYFKEYNKPKTYECILINSEKDSAEISNFITLEKDNNHRKLNFYGLPFSIQKEGGSIPNVKNSIKNLKKIILEKKIDKIDLVFYKLDSSLEYLNNINKENISKISIQKFIELNADIQEIKSQFSKGHKHSINKKFLELTYKIIDHKNYNNEIFDMMKLHEHVSGRSTRSKETWVFNEKMITNKKGFLISVSFGEEIISYSFFYCNNNYSELFSSCTKRKYFKKFNNITHKSIFLAIEYLKNRKFKYFTLGETKILYSENPSSKKLNNIRTFRSSFGGRSIIKIFFKNVNEDIISIYDQD